MSKFDKAFQRLKANLKIPASKIEGSFSIFNLRAVAQESALLSNEMEIIENNWSLDTASGRYLDAKVRDLGLYRRLAGYAYGICRFTGSDGVIIPVNTVIIAPDVGVEFATSKEAKIEGGYVDVETVAVKPGAFGNIQADTELRLGKKIDGVSSVINQKSFEHGTEREDDNNLRLRAYFLIRNPRTSGNVNDYKAWATEIAGVGKVKVFPIWNGPGTVKVSITTSNGTAADERLLQEVKNHIDPDQGLGGGKAPVGAIVTVTSAKSKIINISAKIEVGTVSTLDAITKAFKEEMTKAFAEIAYDEKTDSISPARIGYHLLDIPGVVDYARLTLNGSSDAVPIGIEEIPALGTVELIQAP